MDTAWSRNQNQRTQFLTHTLQIKSGNAFQIESGITVCKKASSHQQKSDNYVL